jgi:hypothetical protein
VLSFDHLYDPLIIKQREGSSEVQDDRQGHFRLTHCPGARGAAQPRFDRLEFEDLLVAALDTVRHHDPAVKDAGRRRINLFHRSSLRERSVLTR